MSVRMDEPLDNLLARLCTGDKAAAEQVFLAFEPYLRKAVRRQLPAPFFAKFDSTDILQSVWADALRGFARPAGVSSTPTTCAAFCLWPRAIVRSTGCASTARPCNVRSRCITATAKALPHRPTRRPSELAPGSRRLDADSGAVRRGASAHPRTEAQGFSLAEIAERMDLHPDSVRRILRHPCQAIGIRHTSAKEGRSMMGSPSEQARPDAPPPEAVEELAATLAAEMIERGGGANVPCPKIS